MSEILRCGTCHFARLLQQDFTKRICNGVPPTPVLPPGSKMLMMAKPIVSVSDEACSHYRGKDMEDAARDVSVMQAIQAMPDTTKQ